MKSILLLVVAVCLVLAVPVMAQTTKTVPLSWTYDDPTPESMFNVKSTRIYDKISGTPVLVAEAPCTDITPPTMEGHVCPLSITFEALKAPHQWVAVSWDGWMESAESNTVVTPGKQPKNLRK